MIYLSTSCLKHSNIKHSVQELADNGFRNIELSGGTDYYPGFADDLLELKEKYGLNYLCHNYFPPPKEHFVINLASLNDDVYRKTFEHLSGAIALSKKLGAKKFGFHAGFFIDISINELGKKITKGALFNESQAILRFIDGFKALQQLAGDLALYVENNVFSSSNFQTYNGEPLFMLCTYADYKALKEAIDFNLLLDVAHLKVSANTLKLDFDTELSNMLAQSDFIHVSDNDALHDLNFSLDKNSPLAALLKAHDLTGKNFTLEIYDSMPKIQSSYEVLKDITT